MVRASPSRSGTCGCQPSAALILLVLATLGGVVAIYVFSVWAGAIE